MRYQLLLLFQFTHDFTKQVQSHSIQTLLDFLIYFNHVRRFTETKTFENYFVL